MAVTLSSAGEQCKQLGVSSMGSDTGSACTDNLIDFLTYLIKWILLYGDYFSSLVIERAVAVSSKGPVVKGHPWGFVRGSDKKSLIHY